MRFLPGLICLLPLLSPLAHAELIDDINDRGELRIALEANTAPFNFKEDGKLAGFEVELGQMLARELDVQADSWSPIPVTCCPEWKAASTTWPSTT